MGDAVKFGGSGPALRHGRSKASGRRGQHRWSTRFTPGRRRLRPAVALALGLLLGARDVVRPAVVLAHESSRAAVRELVYLRGRVQPADAALGIGHVVALRFGRTQRRLEIESWQIFVTLAAPGGEAKEPVTLDLEGPRGLEAALASATPGARVTIVGERGLHGSSLFVAALDVCACPADTGREHPARLP